MDSHFLFVFVTLFHTGLAQSVKDDPKETLMNYHSEALNGPNMRGLPKKIKSQNRNAKKLNVHKFTDSVASRIVTVSVDSETGQGEFPWMAALEHDAYRDPVEESPKEILANYNSAVLPGADVCGLPKNPDAEKLNDEKFPADVKHNNNKSKYCDIVPYIATFTSDSDTTQGEFPWMAGLEYNAYGGIRCGGFLINHRYVLTAAHCLNETEYKLISVWLGMWKQSRVDYADADKVKKLGIEETIRHKFFQSEFDGYDIALIKLNEDVTYTDYIVPICLPNLNLPAPSLGTFLVVAGWGYVTESGPRSDILLKVDLPVVENNKCVEIFNVPVTDHQLCVGGKRGLDSCNGDSGGPLMLKFTNQNGDVQWYPHGIVSFGYGCGRAGKPAVYTRISKYMDWILNKLK